MRPSFRSFAVAVLAAAALLAPAGPCAADKNKEAWSHYDRGVELLDAGAAPTAALLEFLQAYNIDPMPGPGKLIGTHYQHYDPAFQLAKLYERLGNLEEAKKYLDICANYGYSEKAVYKKEYQELRTRVTTLLTAYQPPTRPPQPPPPATPKTEAPRPVTVATATPPATKATPPATTVAENRPPPTATLTEKGPPGGGASAPKAPANWEASVREALRLYLSGSTRRETARAFDRAASAGAFRATDRPGALYVAARFYCEEYIRTADSSDLRQAKDIYRRLRENFPGYTPPTSLRHPKIERLLQR